MDKIDITNQNRERQTIWFEREDEDIYSIHSTSEYALQYAGISYDEVNLDNGVQEDDVINGKPVVIHSFDPSGGPFMAVGSYKINDKILIRIFFDKAAKEFRFQTE